MIAGIDRATDDAKVEQSAQQIDGVKHEMGIDAVRARSRRLESPACVGRRQQLRKVHADLKILAVSEAGQVHAEAGIGAHLSDDLLRVVQLAGIKSGVRRNRCSSPSMGTNCGVNFASAVLLG